MLRLVWMLKLVYSFRILAMEVMPDHIHLLLNCKPQFRISDMVKKEIRMTACAEGKEFYDAGEPYLINPVQKKLTVKADESLTWFYAGESALGKRTMLNEPEIPAVAIDKRQLSAGSLIELDEKWETEKDLLHVEIWKYDPALFAENHVVDPVSMAVSLRDCADERVQGELKEFMEAYQW